jgi:hypothetical protein
MDKGRERGVRGSEGEGRDLPESVAMRVETQIVQESCQRCQVSVMAILEETQNRAGKERESALCLG